MLKRNDSREELPQLFKQLADDGVRVAEAELALARAEAGLIMRRYVIGSAVGGFGVATAVAAILILAEAGVVALAPFVTHPAYAYLCVGLVLVATTIVLALVAGQLFTRRHQPVGKILSWVFGKGEVK